MRVPKQRKRELNTNSDKSRPSQIQNRTIAETRKKQLCRRPFRMTHTYTEQIRQTTKFIVEKINTPID